MLIADRFLSLDCGAFDLSSGERVVVRTMPPVGRDAHVAWSDRCASLSAPNGKPHPDGASLVDYGVLPDGKRFEVHRTLGRRPRAKGTTPSVSVDSSLIHRLTDAFSVARFGEPRLLRLWTSRQPPAEAVFDAIARHARLHGFVPLSLEALLAALSSRVTAPPLLRTAGARELLEEIVRTRHLLIVARLPIRCPPPGHCGPTPAQPSSICPSEFARVIVRLGTGNARPNLVLAAGGCPREMRHRCRLLTGAFVSPETAADQSSDRSIAAEARETYDVRTSDLARLDVGATAAAAHARYGRYRKAEYGLRELAGALARRDDLVGSAWATVNLGCVLLDRGRVLEAARSFEQANNHFDHGRDARGSVRAAIYLGLAWTDAARLAEAEAAFRTAIFAAREIESSDLLIEARAGLARCLYWQCRFDEAIVLVSSMLDELHRHDPPEGGAAAFTDASPVAAFTYASRTERHELARDPVGPLRWPPQTGVPVLDRRVVSVPEAACSVRLSSLASRLALATSDVSTAASHGRRALDCAQVAGAAVDLCTAHTALAAACAAVGDEAGVERHVRAGLAAARRAHSPLRALRLRLIAADSLRHTGRAGEARKMLARLGALDPARFPALVRARLRIVLAEQALPGARAEGGGASRTAQPLLVPACPWRVRRKPTETMDEVVDLLQMCHDIEDEETALARVCETLRERTHAMIIGVVGGSGGATSVLARCGCGVGRSEIAARVLDTGLPLAGVATTLGVEAASPVRYGGSLVASIYGRWAPDALVDSNRVGRLLAAAAAAVAPMVRSLLDGATAPQCGQAGDDAELVGSSAAIEALRRKVRRAAGAPFPVLVQGESGSGKELVARAIHVEGPRRSRRFCAVNCAALTDELLEAELFGHARGAFTGAIAERAGLFEEADGGTLFLDEVADLSPRAQAKLLRAVQEGEVRRIGENMCRRVDVRLVAATNRDLESEAAAGTFRRDLLYRLNVIHIDVPPLRERAEDIPLLATHFWQRASARTGGRATLAPSTLAALARYDWPGNVRELQNVMAALAVSAPRRGSVGPGCLPGAIAAAYTKAGTLDEARRGFERRFVRAALAQNGGHRGRAARSLGISRQGLAKLMLRLGIE